MNLDCHAQRNLKTKPLTPMESNLLHITRELAKILNTSQSAIHRYLEKIGKMCLDRTL